MNVKTFEFMKQYICKLLLIISELEQCVNILLSLRTWGPKFDPGAHMVEWESWLSQLYFYLQMLEGVHAPFPPQ